MGEIPSLWAYQESQEMEQLGQKLLCTTLELEKLKAEAVDEMSKNKEYIKQLILLLKYAVQERDEARDQLQKVLAVTNANASLPANHAFVDSSPSVKPGKANSSVTECNSPSDAYISRSHSSSPVDSLFDGIPSPGMSGFNLAASQPMVETSKTVFGNDQLSSGVAVQDFDHGSMIIDSIVKGRVLPEKGKFLQAVLQAGPLLQTLLVAGPLPRWRNPPQIQPLQIPPVSIVKNDSFMFAQKTSSNVGHITPRSINSHPYHSQLSCGTAQAQAALLLNSANLGSTARLSNASGAMSFGMNCTGYNSSLGKRQRFV